LSKVERIDSKKRELLLFILSEGGERGEACGKGAADGRHNNSEIPSR
jgi:hypothetical protein